MSGSTKSSLHVTHLQMRPYPGSSTPRQKKWRQLAGAGSRHMPGKLGGRAPGKILDRLRFPAKSCQSDLGDEFPKPEHGGLCQLSQAMPPPAIKSSFLQIPCARPLSVRLRRFYRVVNFHVHGLVVRIGGDMGYDAPVEVCGKQFVGLSEKLPQEAAVVNVTGTQLPACPQLISQNIVDTSELAFSHVLNLIFSHFKMVNGGRCRIVQLRF